MVLQQCLACNSLITGLSRSCVCGHVLEDGTRCIGGKRYSEYRAMLYSRLEFQRQKREARENKSSTTHQQQPLGDPQKQMVVTAKKSNFKPVKRRTVGRRTTNKKKIGQISSSTSKQHPATGKSMEVPKELLSRFPSALKEINRRLMGQNMMWLALYS